MFMLDIRDAAGTPQYIMEGKTAALRGFFFLMPLPADLEDLYDY